MAAQENLLAEPGHLPNYHHAAKTHQSGAAQAAAEQPDSIRIFLIVSRHPPPASQALTGPDAPQAELPQDAGKHRQTPLTMEALRQLPAVTLKLGRLDAALLAKVGSVIMQNWCGAALWPSCLWCKIDSLATSSASSVWWDCVLLRGLLHAMPVPMP